MGYFANKQKCDLSQNNSDKLRNTWLVESRTITRNSFRSIKKATLLERLPKKTHLGILDKIFKKFLKGLVYRAFFIIFTKK